MTVDLSKATKGSIVHFRCGGSAPVLACSMSGKIASLDIGVRSIENWYEDGRFHTTEGHPFDIIRIEQPAFNWDEVKAGMCFRGVKSKMRYWYMCKDVIGKTADHWFIPDGGTPVLEYTDHLTRAADQDVT